MSTQDLVTPILPQDYQREIGPKIFHWSQVYFGPNKTDYEEDPQSILSRYVVVAGDIIMHPTNGDWIVTSVNENFVPTLAQRKVVNSNVDTHDSIIVPSNSYNYRNDTMTVDITSTPLRFEINSRVFVFGSRSSHFKVFRGTNVSEDAQPISAVFNESGRIVGDAIELELAAFDRDDITNRSIKIPKGGYLRELPLHGDIVTVVAYTQDGIPEWIQPLVVSHSNFIANSSKTNKHIVDIELDTPYISKNDRSVIEVRRNMLLQSLGLFGIIHYNDGSQVRLPVGGERFKLLGAEAFTASNDFHEASVVLSYSLGKNEAAVNATGTLARAVTKQYILRTVPSDAAYSVKLFVVPIWNHNTSKWELRYKLYDLRRDTTRDVTDLVEQSATYQFNPNLYGQKQTVQVAINLRNLGEHYQFYRPVQVFHITLVKPGTTTNTPVYYYLSYSDDSKLGENLVCNVRNVNSQLQLDFSCGQSTLEDWLRNIYRHVKVIQVKDIAAPPQPTHFHVIKNGEQIGSKYPIANIVKQFDSLLTLRQGDTLIVEFVAESKGEVMQLAALAFNVNVLN